MLLRCLHQVSAQSNLQFGRISCLKTLKMADMAAILDIGTEFFRNSKSPCGLNASDQVWAKSDRVWEQMWFQNFQEGRWSSWIANGKDLSNSESLCCSDASHEVLAQSNLGFWRRCHLKNFNMATLAVILAIRTEQF